MGRAAGRVKSVVRSSDIPEDKTLGFYAVVDGVEYEAQYDNYEGHDEAFIYTIDEEKAKRGGLELPDGYGDVYCRSVPRLQCERLYCYQLFFKYHGLILNVDDSYEGEAELFTCDFLTEEQIRDLTDNGFHLITYCQYQGKLPLSEGELFCQYVDYDVDK